jgi:hypothetical protein
VCERERERGGREREAWEGLRTGLVMQVFILAEIHYVCQKRVINFLNVNAEIL